MELLAQAHTNECGPPGGHSLRLQVGAVQFSLVVGEDSPAPAAVPAWLGEHSFREASSQRVPVIKNLIFFLNDTVYFLSVNSRPTPKN